LSVNALAEYNNAVNHFKLAKQKVCQTNILLANSQIKNELNKPNPNYSEITRLSNQIQLAQADCNALISKLGLFQ
jgi:hypothetical protein